MRKIFTILFIFFVFINQTFAYDASIFTNKNILKIWEKLEFVIKLDWFSENLDILKINWIENFETISNIEAMEFSSKILNVDWKIEEKRETILTRKFILEPKKVWEFILWPVELNDWIETKTTNKLQIKVVWDDILSDKNYQVTKKISQDILMKNEKIHKNNFDFKFFVFVLAIFNICLIIIFLYLFVNKKKKSFKMLPEGKKINFEVLENLEKITDFETEIKNLLKENISKKYNLEISEKSFWELIENIENKDEQRELEEIKKLLEEFNYSEKRKEILSKVKKFLEN